MDRETLAARIDHTVLGPAVGPREARRTVSEAAEHGMNACVPPCYLGTAREAAPEVTLVTVVGFPHGQQDPEVAAAEAERAWEAGADELDVALNVGRLQAGEHDAVSERLAGVVAATPLPVKAILGTDFLDESATRAAAELAREAGADYLKTATGFGPGGATVADVELLAEVLPVKASGGVDDYGDARAMLAAGAERIGSSSGVRIIEGAPD
jgi:deoxyribose-phosphate aldolase